jgi:class 3 adenylate cyclase/tetratricopeptide (TPR) repeat protein
MARLALKELGPQAAGLLQADPSQVWANPSVALAVDLDAHERDLHAALRASPGPGRDAGLVEALSTGGVPLEDEPEAEWAAPVRERVQYLRQEARLELARDRSRGLGRSRPEEVRQAWQACLEADATDEEAAAALMQLYVAQGRRPAAVAVYERCHAALADLGMKTSPALEEVRANADGRVLALTRQSSPAGPSLAGVRRAEERRLVSVVFVELVPGSLGGQVDPEDLRELISAGLAQTMSEVEALGGTVASISGLGMSVLFGAPQSHEDDPERALLAALRTAAAVGQPEAHGKAVPGRLASGMAAPQAALSVRIGVESGTAVVGPMGDGEQVRYGAVGEVVGLAAALQSAARPGTVLVGPATRTATEDIFYWGPDQDITVPSGARPLGGSYLVGARPGSDAEAGRRRLAARATLVGRGAELAVLTDAVRAAVAGQGGAVVLAGEPGIGKTRLLWECRKFFMGWVGAASGRLPLWLAGCCASYASSTPYSAYQQLLCRFIGVPLEAGEAVLRPALGSAVRAALGNDSDVLPVLAHMMGLAPGPGGAHLGRMGPGELQQVTFAAVRSLLAKLVSRGPTVLVLEDLHWSDPTSLRLTAELASLASSGPLLILATRRPEPDPGVGELEAALRRGIGRAARIVDLVPLQRPDERALARSLVPGDIGDEVLDAICEGVDGNPLFLEERVASLRDTGALQRDGGGWRLGRDGTVPLPEALERLIRSRADRLSLPAREVLVAASVLGQEIDHSGLGVVSELDAELDDAVAEVVSAGLLVEIPGSAGRLYRFRHALIREATYCGLLRPQRRQLHGRAAWELEARSEGRLDEVAAVLGGHFAAAGEADRAVHYLEMAGDHAARVFANEEAIALYRLALAVIGLPAGGSVELGSAPAAGRSAAAAGLCAKLGDALSLVDRFEEARWAARAGLATVPPDETLQAARLQWVLGSVEFQTGNYNATLAAHTAAEELIGAPALDDDQEWVDLWLFFQLWYKHLIYAQRGELERCAALIETARPVAQARATGQVTAFLYNALAFQHLRERRHRFDDQIVAEFRRAVDAARSPEPPSLGSIHSERIRVPLMNYLGIALTWHGDLDEARRVYDQALMIAEREGSPGARGAILVEMAITEFRMGDVDVVRDLLPKAKAAAATRGDPYHSVAAKGLEAWVAWRDGRLEEALALGTEALGLWQPNPEFHPYCLAFFPVAAAYLATGRAEQAVGTARRLLEPTHAALPDELEAVVQAGCDAWDRGEAEKAGKLLGEAVLLARDLGYA